MNETYDFLTKPTKERLKKEIVNICDSYSHPWDILAELCQNSVDAIHSHLRKYGETVRDHEIHISIDAIERSITIRDTGIGFTYDNFVNLLAPHGTDKKPDDLSNIGQKGVGITYVIFSSNKFDIESKSIDSHIKGSISDAVLWKNGKLEETPCFIPEKFEHMSTTSENTFTKICINGVEDIFNEEEDVFNQKPEILEFILRTKTAIGSTVTVFDECEKGKMRVNLIIKNKDGKSSKRDIEPSFMLPESFTISSRLFIDYDDFVKLAATLDDRQKTQRLQGKCLRKKGAITRAGRNIKYYAVFAAKRAFWKEISTMNNLVRYSSDLKDDETLYNSGIFISSRGMPTGITLSPPLTGEAGYWPNLFILLEDDHIVFDLGRKSVPGRTQGLLKEIAKDRFNEFIKFRKYITQDPPTSQAIPTIQQYEKNNEFDELKKLPNIDIEEISYIKHPNSQEAAIVAIFHELLGAKLLKGYRSLKHGYKETYDMWGYYYAMRDNVGSKLNITEGTQLPIIIEFKYQGEFILSDFDKRTKYFADIDLIVCWNLDEKKFSKEGVRVSVLKPEDALFHGSNYELEWPGSYNLGSASKKPVLALKRFIEDYQRNN